MHPWSTFPVLHMKLVFTVSYLFVFVIHICFRLLLASPPDPHRALPQTPCFAPPPLANSWLRPRKCSIHSRDFQPYIPVSRFPPLRFQRFPWTWKRNVHVYRCDSPALCGYDDAINTIPTAYLCWQQKQFWSRFLKFTKHKTYNCNRHRTYW